MSQMNKWKIVFQPKFSISPLAEKYEGFYEQFFTCIFFVFFNFARENFCKTTPTLTHV